MKQLFFFLSGVLLLAAAGCVNPSITVKPDTGMGSVTSTVPSEKPATSTAAVLDKALCESGHGHWNECGSPCRNQPEGSPCIMMCEQQCECGGIAGWGCPVGYTCTDYVPGPQVPDAMGVCKSSVIK